MSELSRASLVMYLTDNIIRRIECIIFNEILSGTRIEHTFTAYFDDDTDSVFNSYDGVCLSIIISFNIQRPKKKILFPVLQVEHVEMIFTIYLLDYELTTDIPIPNHGETSYT